MQGGGSKRKKGQWGETVKGVIMGRIIRVGKSKETRVSKIKYRLEDNTFVLLFHHGRLERRHDRLEQATRQYISEPHV